MIAPHADWKEVTGLEWMDASKPEEPLEVVEPTQQEETEEMIDFIIIWSD